MKRLIQLAVLLLLAGCATPYYPVYTSSSGEYYITEKPSGSSVYGSSWALTSELLNYPWWMEDSRFDVYFSYSPYFYPYYFSGRYPRYYHPFYGFYRRHHVYWCPPYRQPPGGMLRPGNGRTDNPEIPMPVMISTIAPLIEARQSNDLAGGGAYGGGQTSIARRADRQFQSVPGAGSSSSLSSPRMSSSRSIGRRSVSRPRPSKSSRSFSGTSVSGQRH